MPSRIVEDHLQPIMVFDTPSDVCCSLNGPGHFLTPVLQQERLAEQKKERETKGQAYSESFKPQRSKDEAKERRKAILSSIGEDLLLAAADQPFRFPATFTFVVRSFTVLDGIGKSLDAR